MRRFATNFVFFGREEEDTTGESIRASEFIFGDVDSSGTALSMGVDCSLSLTKYTDLPFFSKDSLSTSDLALSPLSSTILRIAVVSILP